MARGTFRGDYFRGNMRTLNQFVFQFRTVCTKETFNEEKVKTKCIFWSQNAAKKSYFCVSRYYLNTMWSFL